MLSLYLWAVFTFIVLAAIMWHLMSDEVRFPVEGLWTLVAFIFSVLGVTQRVGLQTTANIQSSVLFHLCLTGIYVLINTLFYTWFFMLIYSPLEAGKYLVTFLTLMGTMGNVDRLQFLWILSFLVTFPFKENHINQEKYTFFFYLNVGIVCFWRKLWFRFQLFQ